jgi:6-pyruvoyl-tetrahydropterin synthase
MYTQVGRIMSKQEAKRTFEAITNARETRELVDVSLTYLNPTTKANIRVQWTRAHVGLNSVESMSVTYTSFDEKINDEELFDDIFQFAEAYKLK